MYFSRYTLILRRWGQGEGGGGGPICSIGNVVLLKALVTGSKL